MMQEQLTIPANWCMKMEPIPVHRVMHEWTSLLSFIKPSNIKGGGFDEMALMRDLMNGSAEAAYVTGFKIKGAFVSQITNQTCTINYLGGSISARPKEWLQLVRWGMQVFEDLARKSHCREMRLSGRKWGFALKALGYEPVENGLPNELRKVL